MRPKAESIKLGEFASLPGRQVLEVLHSTLNGLDPDEASSRLKRAGPNRLPEGEQHRLLLEFTAQFTHFFALLLWVSAALAFLGGMPELGWAVVIVVTINGLFSFLQEFRAERATRALAALLPSMALVKRAGEQHLISATDVVAGDLLVLIEGARVSADARVLNSAGLRIDNSALTGESEPVERSSEAIASSSVDGVDYPNLVFAGSWVISGSALAIVVATGASTRLGTLSQMAGAVRRRASPLRLSVNRAVRVMGAVALGAGLVFALASVLLGMKIQDSLLFSVGVIVALVPEGLLPTLTLALAMSAARMARRGALVRHLEAVETLGSTTVICTDKTGTLTTNQMTVTQAWTCSGQLSVTGTGYGPNGAIFFDGKPLSPSLCSDLEPLLLAAALCGDARIEQRDGRWRCLGDPTEGALVAFARKGGMSRELAEQRAPRIAVFPFESKRARMSTVHILPSGEERLLTKGSAESVLPLCSSILRSRARGSASTQNGAEIHPLTPSDRKCIEAQLEELAAQGLRVLTLAHRVTQPHETTTLESAEHDLVFLGLLGMWDPVRAEVPTAIAQCQAAGIRVLMVTGDHPVTAATIAHHVGLRGEVLLGCELPTDELALERLLGGHVSTLARVAPEQKLTIARALQRRGEVVAMTGDGVNDAPALRQADIGVAMGASGTDVAREAADLILLDDNFLHIVEAVEEGRAAFANIRRFLTYHLTDNVAELTPFLCWALSAGSFPLVLSVLQILALDIGTDLLPALALGAEQPEPQAMREPPRTRNSLLLDRKVLGRAFGFLGLLEAAASLSLVPVGAFLFLGWSIGMPWPHSASELPLLSTLVFSSIVLMQVANAFECRSTPKSSFSNRPLSNRLLLGAVVVEFFLLFAFIYEPHVQRLLGHVPLTLAQWGLIMLTPAFLLAAEESRKLIVRALLAVPERGHQHRWQPIGVKRHER